MKAFLFLLLLVFIYSIPNPVYVIKDCFEKLYDVNSNAEIKQSINNELLNWKIRKFFTKVEAIDPTLVDKINKCVDEVLEKYRKPRRNKIS